MGNIAGKPFTDVLGEIENGVLLDDLTEQIYELVEAVMDVRKEGALTLKLRVSPTAKGSVDVYPALEVKKPKHDRSTTSFFVGADYALLRSDPNQPDLPLRAVEREDHQPIRKIND